MPKKHVPKNHAAKIAYTHRLVEGLSPVNRDAARRFLIDKSALTGVAHAQCLAVALAKLDRFLNGSAIAQAKPEQLRDFLLDAASRHSASTVYGDAARIRTFLKWAWDVDELPREYKRALKRPSPKLVKDRKPITDEEFRALLAAADESPYAHKRLKWQAMLWVLWDSGFRLGEMLSLRVGSVEFDEKDGARLRLRDGDYGLKTGARTVYVVECVGPLKAWLAFPPAAGDEAAYLFPSSQDDPTSSFWPENVYVLVQRLARTAGLRPINPHLFRHTRATRAARAGWNEAQMRAYLGWSLESSMPAVYIHLAEADMETVVRRDVGIDARGARLASPMNEGELDAALRRLIRRAMSE